MIQSYQLRTFAVPLSAPCTLQIGQYDLLFLANSISISPTSWMVKDVLEGSSPSLETCNMTYCRAWCHGSRDPEKEATT